MARNAIAVRKKELEEEPGNIVIGLCRPSRNVRIANPLIAEPDETGDGIAKHTEP